jgi:TrwC relaxase
LGRVALPVKALKAGQESYWLDQIARNREEYFSGRGESPGRFVGSAARASGLEGVASAEQVQAMFQGLDPATGEQRCSPLLRADPRSKLTAGPLLDALGCIPPGAPTRRPVPVAACRVYLCGSG